MKKGSIITLGAFSILFILGIVCWALQLTQGMQLTSLNNYSTWGLYIIGFMIFTGITAGSLLFTSSVYLFKGMEEFKPYTRISSFVGAICGVLGAGLFIFVDTGNPIRTWHIITRVNTTSPLFWDTMILIAYVIIGILFTRLLIMVNEGKREEKSLKPISVVAFVAGLLVMATSFVFAMQVGRPLWNNPVQPVSFLAAAIVVAFALQIIVLAILNKTKRIEISSEQLGKLGKIAGIFLLFELFVVLGEAAIGLYAWAGEENKILRWLVLGRGAPFFWIEVVAIIAGMIVLWQKKNKTAVTVTGAGVALFAIFMVKYNLLQAQLLNPPITYAGPAGYNVAQAGVYLPSLVEVGTSLGVVALGGLLVMLGVNKLNLGAGSKQRTPDTKVRYDQGSAIKS